MKDKPHVYNHLEEITLDRDDYVIIKSDRANRGAIRVCLMADGSIDVAPLDMNADGSITDEPTTRERILSGDTMDVAMRVGGVGRCMIYETLDGVLRVPLRSYFLGDPCMEELGDPLEEAEGDCMGFTYSGYWREGGWDPARDIS